MGRQPAQQRRSVEELKKLQTDLRKLSKRGGWDTKIRQELKGPAADAKRAVEKKIQAIPSKGISARQGRESLRRKMLRALKTNVDTTKEYTGAFVYLDAYEMPSGEENLPAYMERLRRYTRWRHTVFGNESVWVTQRAHPYFYRTLKPWENTVADIAERVIDQQAREFER